MSDGEDSSTGSDSNGQTNTNGGSGNGQKPNRLKIKACDLEVSAQSTEMDVDEMMEVCSEEMESVMEYHLVGDMAAIEERDLFAEIFGGHR